VESQPAKGKKVSLASATDKLQGVLDAVVDSVSKVQSGFETIRASCGTHVEESTKRQEAQAGKMAELGKSRLINHERTAGLEASLAHLVSQETDAHQSYESAVSQRADALQKHLSSNKASVDQANALGGALEMMKQKRALIVDAATDKYKDNEANVPVAAATQQGSALDFIIGVLTSMRDSSKDKAEEGADKHNEDDADMEKLVTSYKSTLQHIDQQYQKENARRMEAKSIAQNAGDEQSLRNMMVDGEEKLTKKFVALCGIKGKGGDLEAKSQEADHLLKTFKQQSANALNIMDTLPDLISSFLSIIKRPLSFLSARLRMKGLGGRVRQQRMPAAANLTSPPTVADSARESAARWVMSQAAKVRDRTSQQFAKAVNASFPHGVPPAPRPHVQAVAPGQPVHMLVGAARVLQSTGAGSQKADPKKAGAKILACVKDKQDLTDKIIEARKSARTARTERMSAEARMKATIMFMVMSDDQKLVLQKDMKKAEKAWQPLKDVIAKKSFTQDLSDAISEMTSIQKDVDAYIAAGGPPAASGLPSALKAISGTLSKIKTQLEADMKVVDDTFADSFLISYSALINQLGDKSKAFEKEMLAMEDKEKSSAKTAKAAESSEKDLMIQRSGVEYRCLHNSTCALLHYQQSCGGDTTFTKRVTSWNACVDHCEQKIKEGHKIAGCEIMFVASDDPTTSGMCSAQTTCNLKATKSKGAASLCKVTPR
jgi:hypothetical protein